TVRQRRGDSLARCSRAFDHDRLAALDHGAVLPNGGKRGRGQRGGGQEQPGEQQAGADHPSLTRVGATPATGLSNASRAPAAGYWAKSPGSMFLVAVVT